MESNIDNLVNAVIQNMKRDNYSDKTIEYHLTVYRALKRFCVANDIKNYDENVGVRFLGSDKTQQLGADTKHRYIVSISKLECAVKNIDWKPKQKAYKEVPTTVFDKEINEYESYLTECGKTERHIYLLIHGIISFLLFAEHRGCKNLSDISPEIIYNSFQETDYKIGFRQNVGAFLRYAYKRNLTEVNLSLVVPSVRRHSCVPTVYTLEEVEKLLVSINRTSEMGKRNYAMTLIAARLGLRAGDIANLKFDNINVKKAMIIIKQAKTNRHLSSPFLPEIQEAINDYVQNGRPKSDNQYIFLKFHSNQPVTPAAVSAAIHRTFMKSGIDCIGRKSHSHALRSSLATALLAEGQDYQIIQKALGHATVATTKFYAKAEVESLRVNALPIPLPSGQFKELLEKGVIDNERIRI